MIIRNAMLAALGALAILPGIPERVLGQQPRGAGAPSSDPPVAATTVRPVSTSPSKTTNPQVTPKPTLGDLSWLAGRWQGTWGPRIAQQVWTPPRAGVMLGTFQLAENDKTLVLEFVTLVAGPDGIKFHLRHFTPSLVPWEKPGPTMLDLAGADPKIIVFENPSDGQPKRITITRLDADTYISRSEIVPRLGDPQVTEITYHRQKDFPPARR
jgi:hypothetical protein